MNASYENALTSFLLSVFNEPELRRFVRAHFGEKAVHIIDRMSSGTEFTFDLVRTLSKEKLLDHTFFDELKKRAPDQATVLDWVSKEYFVSLQEDAPVLTSCAFSTSGSPRNSHAKENTQRPVERGVKKGSAADAHAREKWKTELAALLQEEEAVPAPTPGHGWLDAAAVLPWFDSTRLNPVPGQEVTQKDALVRLAAVCDVRPDGQWALQTEPRQECIARLWQTQQLAAALAANREQHTEPYASMLRDIIDVADRWELTPTPDQLAAAKELNVWFKTSDYTPYEPNQLAAHLERQAQIRPLKRLTRNFRGRRDELERLEQHRCMRGGSTAGSAILVLTGKGGVGKSALLGKYLLYLENGDHHPTPAWIHLDFDDSEVDPTRPRKLIEIAARQLSLLFLGSQFLSLESASSDDATPLAWPPQHKGERGRDTESLLAELHDIIEENARSSAPALLLVLDTFEQVQARGEAAVLKVRDFLDLVLKHLPYARIIVSGRAPVTQWQDTTILALDNLDAESADAVLQDIGVEPPELRTLVTGQLGTSPLSLRLAAEAIRSGSLDAGDIKAVCAQARNAEVQGYLYTRILGHIPDTEVRKLAHPGLIVRRITPEVIERVLAPICDLPASHAAAIFARLPDHASLFESDVPGPHGETALRHRQDVRELMLRLMPEDPQLGGKIRPVHKAAAAYYRGSQHAAHRAEEIYHTLMLGAPPHTLEPLWPPDLDKATAELLTLSLGRCWDEPMPEPGRKWLGIRLGRVTPETAAAGPDANAEEREFTAYRTASQLLEQGEAQGALSTITDLPFSPEPGTPLYTLKIRTLLQLGRHAEASPLLRAALAHFEHLGAKAKELEFLLLGMELTQSDVTAADEFEGYARRAEGIAQTANDDLMRLKIFEVMAAHAVRHSPSAFPSQISTLASYYAQTPEDLLREEPYLSRHIVSLAAPYEKSALIKAARTFGNLQQQNVLKTDPLQLARLVAQSSQLLAHYELSIDIAIRVPWVGQMQSQNPAANALSEELRQLAKEVGLGGGEQTFNTLDLAAAAARYGRMGDLIAIVLQHAGGIDAVRTAAAALFLPPAPIPAPISLPAAAITSDDALESASA